MESDNNALLAIALDAAVPLLIMDLMLRGGPSERDVEHVRNVAPVLAEMGDRLLYASARKGETAALFTDLAHALAVLAFSAEGITFAGHHWQAVMPGSASSATPASPHFS